MFLFHIFQSKLHLAEYDSLQKILAIPKSGDVIHSRSIYSIWDILETLWAKKSCWYNSGVFAIYRPSLITFHKGWRSWVKWEISENNLVWYFQTYNFGPSYFFGIYWISRKMFLIYGLYIQVSNIQYHLFKDWSFK